MSRRERRAERIHRRHRRELYALAVFLVALGLTASAIRFAPLVEAEEPPVRIPSDLGSSQPLDAFGLGTVAYANLYDYLTAVEFVRRAEVIQANRARALRVHECEEGGVGWYPAGGTSDGWFEGGMGLEASAYRSIAGHSALLDTPEQQMDVAIYAHDTLGIRWAPKCEAQW